MSCSGLTPFNASKADQTQLPEETIAPKVAVGEGDDLIIDSMQVIVEESSPVQVAVIVNGSLPDSCTSIVRLKTDYKNLEFVLEILTRRKVSTDCLAGPLDFEEFVFLDVENLAPGTYNVSLNGITEVFILEEDRESG